MDISTAYKTLDLENNASKEDILAAYRKLAKQWHPDVNKDPEAEEKFKQINIAYELLTHPQQQQPIKKNANRPYSPFSSSVFFTVDDFESIFETMNNSKTSNSRSPTTTTITLELEDSSSPQLANKIIQILSENGIKIKGYNFVTTTRQA